MHTLCDEFLDPLRLYATIRELGKDPFILETTVKDKVGGGHTYIASDPSFVIEIGGKGTYIDGQKISDTSNPFQSLKTLSRKDCQEPLNGCFVGYVAYDAVQNIICGNVEESSVFGFYKDIYVIDHQKRKLGRVLEGMEAQVPKEVLSYARDIDLPMDKSEYSKMSTDADEDMFVGMVNDAKEQIYSGDAFQVVLSREYRLRTSSDPFRFYRDLREINPSPYLFLMEFGSKSIAGSSPETMASVKKNIVQVNPIAGTTRRGAGPEEDADLAISLLEDEKERAEHIMLVDLARNDVGKVSEPRTISIPTMMKVRKYSHVQHIESEVTGVLRKGMTSFDAIEASFPAGTLTGAPKIRAMEIIDELEMSKRRVYGGCVGYFNTNGNADTAIAIRMAEFDDVCRIRAGAGIVADSDPLSEFDETERKMSALFSAFERGCASSY